MIVVALLAHGYREGEYLIHAANKFCLNPPLFIVNTVKLVGLLTVLGLAALAKVMQS